MTNKNDDSISRAYYKLGKQIMEELQSALIYGTKDKEKKHPHWIPIHSQWSRTWECSECGYRVNLEDGGVYHYCSACGSKMEEREDDCT